MGPYPNATDRFWMEPGSDLPYRVDPYTLLAVADYGSNKRQVVYLCICMRCGALHRILRVQLQLMARQQRKRAKQHHAVWPPFSGHCPACSESAPAKLTGAEFSRQLLNAKGLFVLHCFRNGGAIYQARIGIYDSLGRLTEARPYQGAPWPVFLEATGPSSALASAEEMFCRLLAKLSKAQVTTIYSRDGTASYLHAFCLPSGVRLR